MFVQYLELFLYGSTFRPFVQTARTSKIDTRILLNNEQFHTNLGLGMARKQKEKATFGLPGGLHRISRRAVNPGRPAYKYSCSTKDQDSFVLVVRRRRADGKKNRKTKKQRKMKNFYHLYRNCHDKKLHSRPVKRLIQPQTAGYRLTNLGELQKHVAEISLHAATCEKALKKAAAGISPIELTSEINNLGLASVLASKCKGCDREICFNTSPRLNIDKKSNHFDINVRAVWGTLSTGSGHSHMSEFLATVDSPGMTQPVFSRIETDINKWWNGVLQEELAKAIEEEKQIAIEKGRYHQGVPSVTVICDGGWSKRTHKHSYNALGGVGVIIGAETKKVLHVGIRNKYCCVCQRAENVGCAPKPHECFKNWSLSSQAMEADIILEGFLKADGYGVRYMTVIADGDSSTYARIRDEVPVWGQDVKKGECANHVCKCLRSNLEKLVDQNPNYKGKGNLTKLTRVRLTSAVRCAIRMRSLEDDKSKAARSLEKDIKNSVFHIYGQHDNCSPDFCKAKQMNDTCTTEECGKQAKGEGNETIDIIEEQCSFWEEGSSMKELEESRNSTSVKCDNPQLIKDISIILGKVAAKSQRLIGNFTTNLAECWMYIRTKFDGGKMFNRCYRGSWHTRCFASGLRFNEGPKWSPVVWGKVTGTPPGENFTKVYNAREQRLFRNRISKSKKHNKVKRWKRKLKSTIEANTKKARLEYGPEARDVTPDVTKSELTEKMDYFYNHEVKVDVEEIKHIEIKTKQQSGSKIWRTERKKRLTSSNFGQVYARNTSIKVEPLVRTMLYSTFKGNQSTKTGLEKEDVTLQEYVEVKRQNKENVTVQKVGLVVSKQHPFIAASPDAKVCCEDGDCGLVEIKNLLYNKPVTLTQAAKMKSMKNFCLEIEKSSGQLMLKRSHKFYYQCQGLLSITQLNWIDFVVRTERPYELHIERILLDNDLWQLMLPKLKGFYFKAILPELALPRHGKYPGIREPGIWCEAKKISKVPTQASVQGVTQRTSRSKANVLWSEDAQQEVRRLFEEYQDKVEDGKDTVDHIMARITDVLKTRGQIIKELKRQDLITSAKDIRKPKGTRAGPWNEDDEQELTELYQRYKDSDDPVGGIISEMCKRRSRPKVMDKLLTMGVVADRKDLYKKRASKSGTKSR